MPNPPAHQVWITEGDTATSSSTSMSLTTVTFAPAVQVRDGLHQHETFMLHAPAHVPAWIVPGGPHMATPLELPSGSRLLRHS